MLIESLIKPKKAAARTVVCFGTTYKFTPPAGLPGRYIADVQEERAIKALIATGAYREFTDKVPSSTLQPAGLPKETEAQRQAKAAEAERVATAQRAAAEQAEQVAREQEAAAAAAEAAGGDGEDTGEGDESGEAAEITDAEVTRRAQTLLSGPAKSIRSAVEKGVSDELPREVVAAALKIESEQAQPRPSVVKALQAAVG